MAATNDLYDKEKDSKYWCKNGFSVAAIISLVAGALVSIILVGNILDGWLAT